jgi:hypothetical protein
LLLVDLGYRKDKALARLIANIACVQHPETREQNYGATMKKTEEQEEEGKGLIA